MNSIDSISTISAALEKYRAASGNDLNMAKTDLFVSCKQFAIRNRVPSMPGDYSADTAQEFAIKLIQLCQGANIFDPNKPGLKATSITNRASETSTQRGQLNTIAKTPATNLRVPGGRVFSAIVTVLRNRTGMDYSRAFNLVLADNRDLLRESLDGTNHTRPLLRLLNRTEMATGLRAVASTELAVDKVTKLTNRFFPSLSNAPTALQWDVLCRTALQLEKCGIAQRIFNRADIVELSNADWKAANDRADGVFSLLETQASQSTDRGTKPFFQKAFEAANPERLQGMFKGAIKQLMNSEGLNLRQAFDHLKEAEPIFWTHAMLSFEPEKQ
jgi:hypothetical protein